MAPLGLKRAVIEKITGVYIPVYLYSATARSNYQASIEESYQKTSLKVESDTRVSLGSRNRSEFYELAGPHVMYVSDILISASHAVSNQELQAIEPFDLSQLRRYSPALISGWDAEFPSRTKEEGMHVARTETESLISHTLRDFMPGDGVRNLRHNTDFQQESLTPTLVPVWVCAIRYSPHKPPLKILVNGQSGTVGGVVSRSWLKRLVWLSAGIAIVTALGIAIWKITQMVL